MALGRTLPRALVTSPHLPLPGSRQWCLSSQFDDGGRDQ
ncbi:hypothetical protein SLNWT_5594 [Streptomyces albus]|uniref:Uncharacterized protein n=1 Tax=Streptomyces albus (strain ATCC 21838 / DSM 41398 / FERM P-419 / JCM 4703 / NBRC 107858) TaxID=1081613 RepID=A0A0B5F307_STRA4|nr:hypothetical protein SLNWT_5594 [Streptomyces albus]AOU80272.1 hypothetical protein SLNHY_5581 [Streptomyces albus]